MARQWRSGHAAEICDDEPGESGLSSYRLSSSGRWVESWGASLEVLFFGECWGMFCFLAEIWSQKRYLFGNRKNEWYLIKIFFLLGTEEEEYSIHRVTLSWVDFFGRCKRNQFHLSNILKLLVPSKVFGSITTNPLRDIKLVSQKKTTTRNKHHEKQSKQSKY